MAKVELKNLTKYHDRTKVFEGLNLEIEDGEFLALVGPSGCGKSTLLRLIAGLDKVSSGEIIIDGVASAHLPPQKRGLSMVFQSYALYPHMTVYDNISYGLKVRGSSKEEIVKKVDWAASILKLKPLLKRKPANLSGGQRQRVAMGRSMVGSPKAFLFDEPLSNLDAKLRVQMRGEIKSLHYTLKNTIIYVTHDQIEAMTMANRVAVMQGGKFQQIGPPLKLYDFPENIFVAGFIGSPSMNFLNGTIQKKNGEIGVRLAGEVFYPVNQSYEVVEGQEVILGVRPEHFSLADKDGWQAEVNLVEQTGSQTSINLSFCGSELNFISNSRIEAEIKSTISIFPKAEKIHLFDKLSEKRIKL